MRGKQAPKRYIAPDAKFQSVPVAKFINYVMERGKKSTAQRIVYGAFDIVSQKTKGDAMEIFDKAIKNVGPSLEVRGKRVGGANYQIPYPVRVERKFALACRWIKDAAAKRKGPMAQKLASELMDAATEQGEAFRKKMDVHKMAEANRAFAHFAR